MKRRDAGVLLVGGVLGLIGWAGQVIDFLPIRVIREPGWEIGTFLIFAYRSTASFIPVSEWLVFTINVLFWAAVLISILGIRRAFLRAWRAHEWLLSAALVAVPFVSVAELLGQYFGDPLGKAWWLTYPGWVLKDLIAWLPSMTVVMDMRSLLGEFAYPDRLANLTAALILATVVWTIAFWMAILMWRVVTRRRADEHVRVA